MQQTVDLFLNANPVGAVTRLSGGRFEFEYAAPYRADEAHHPLSLSMPTTAAVHRDSRGESIVSNFMWGLLPDDREVLRRYATHFNVPENDPLAILEAIGEDCPGAVSFGTPGRERGLGPLDEAAMADVIDGLKRGRTPEIFGRNPGYFSLAGAQPKTALVYRDGHWYMPLGDEPSTHIVKPAMRDLEDQPLNEHFCLQLAREAGLAAPESWVEQVGNEQAIVVERFDRITDDGLGTLRIHIEDMCQALGYAPSQKYEENGGPGIRAIGELLRDNATEPAADLEQFMRAVMFNVLVCGTDAHAKNYSIWHVAGPQMALAPLYDINSVYPYFLRRNERKMAMAVRGKKIQHGIRPEHFEAEGRALGLPAEQVRAWLTEMGEQLPERAQVIQDQMPYESLVIDRIVGEITSYTRRLLGQLRRSRANYGKRFTLQDASDERS
ncbi:type II toxin-antitoxin system HipA family toxin [Salinisphaera sp.]|uniref:type II toxin-antitoxin system HipA family toxin n=1 Tax=Salinisphaera sp. TaxID=1914330 RepID=UPI002D784C6A|nr:type II toxin-antitoxin system HipA family toxin [Salinisphaera sp.]HET7314774.1 type II toxin-antitoxin system HipA family toxin [Salinisphaera sp.]